MSAAASLTDPLPLAQALIRCPSVTPVDAGALDVAQSALEDLGFDCHRLPFGGDDRPAIDNLFARRGTGSPFFCFGGHTDVVPPGDPAAWRHDPFAAVVEGDWLYGRGACDMKGGVAAMIAGTAGFLEQAGPSFDGSLAFVLTGDEEAQAVDGTVKVLDWMAAHGHRPDAVLVGEPTSTSVLGDTIKIGRRGSLDADIVIDGVQGHVAYPQRADNPVHRLAALLAELTAAPLDTGTEHFEPSTLQVTSVDVGNPARNVVPARARALLNSRFNPLHDAPSLIARLETACARHCPPPARYQLTTRAGAEAFLTEPGPLSDAVVEAIRQHTGTAPALSTGGGTSDARFFRRHAPVVELGMINDTIHQVNERVPVADLRRMADLYAAVLANWFRLSE